MKSNQSLDISILVGLKNNLDYSKLFYSTTRSLYPTVEIVFVSYGSTDGTHEWLDSLNDSHVKYFYSEETKTFSDTYNKCSELATCTYIVFLHNDMILTSGFLENILKHQKEDTIVGFSTIEPPVFSENQRLGKVVQDFGTDIEGFKKEALYEFASVLQEKNKDKQINKITLLFFIAIPNKAFKLAGGMDNLFSPMFSEDDDLFLRLERSGMKIILSLDAICYHFVSKTSRFSEDVKQETKAMELHSQRNFLRKWGFASYEKKKEVTPSVGFVLTNATPQLIYELEPYCNCLYVDIDFEEYIRTEQPHTKYDLRDRVKRIGEQVARDIQVVIDGNMLNKHSLQTLKKVYNTIEKRNKRWYCRLFSSKYKIREKGVVIYMKNPNSLKKTRISYAVTVCTEAMELKRLLNCLLLGIDENDNILILSDKSNVTKDVLDVIDHCLSSSKSNQMKHVSYPLNNDFASFKNQLIAESDGDYLFQIDADEVPNPLLFVNLKRFLSSYKKRDCFSIPRVNLVHGISEEQIQQWKWEVNEKGWLNYPDFQMRIFKLNADICWKNKVHEVLVNYKKNKRLPYKENDDYCLYHYKEISRQLKQIEYYDTII